jgi:hypothetical protein
VEKSGGPGCSVAIFARASWRKQSPGGGWFAAVQGFEEEREVGHAYDC